MAGTGRWKGGALAVGLLIGGGLLWIGLQRFQEARLRAREDAAIAQLRLLYEGQDRFYQDDLEGDGVYDFATLDELIALELVSDSLAAAAGYRLQVAPEGPRWQAWAEPLEEPGRRFFTDQTGVIRVEAGERASAASPALD